jgi:adenylyltransferase/sulfurtransferase
VLKQANETIKLITGIGQPLINRLLTYNALNNQVYEIALTASADTGNLIPENIAAFTSMDYNWDCAVNNPPEVSLREFNTLLNNKYITIIDVRETGERPIITEFKNTHIPLNQLAEKLPVVNTEVVIAFCQSGKRSMKAAKLLSDAFGATKKVYSLKGGITNWKQNN